MSPEDPAFWDSGARVEEKPGPSPLLPKIDFDKKKPLMLKKSLKGAAARFMLGLPAGVLGNYLALRKALVNRYNPPEAVYVKRAQLRGRRHQPGKSPSKLADDLRVLVSRSYRGASDNSLDVLCHGSIHWSP